MKKKIKWVVSGIIIWVFLIALINLGLRKHLLSFITPNYMSEKAGMTDLHWAAWEGRTKDIEKLISRGAEVNCKDINGNTPLHFAASSSKEVVALLIAKGAEVNARENDQSTPLHNAAGMGRAEIVKLLLAAGADINARNKKGWTPLGCVYARQAAQKESFPFIFKPFGWYDNKRLKDCAELLRSNGAKE